MVKTILYFHGFASSSNSNKAKLIKNYFSKLSKNINVFTPDLKNNFSKAIVQINQLINMSDREIAFMGSSLGGYYASIFSNLSNSKAVLINPAISPLIGFEKYLGENKNYSTGEKFYISKKDIKFLRLFGKKKFRNQKNTLILLESGDDVLNYLETVSYYKGSRIDIKFGGTHSYDSMNIKLQKICDFLKIY